MLCCFSIQVSSVRIQLHFIKKNYISKRSGSTYAVTATSATSGWVINMASNSAGAIYNGKVHVKQDIMWSFYTCLLENTIQQRTDTITAIQISSKWNLQVIFYFSCQAWNLQLTIKRKEQLWPKLKGEQYWSDTF